MVIGKKKETMSERANRRGVEILAAGKMKDENEKKKALAGSGIKTDELIKTQDNHRMEYDELIGKRKWLVIHAAELYDIKPNLIGFRDPQEWGRIKTNDIVFYYRTSPYTQIMGIYKVVRSGESIDINFCLTKKDGRHERLRYQHELELVNPFQCYFGKDKREQLSFYHLLKNPTRLDKQNVFPMSQGDLELIMK